MHLSAEKDSDHTFALSTSFLSILRFWIVVEDYSIDFQCKLNTAYTLCSEKTPTHIFFHISMSDLNKNCSEYT